MDPLDFVAERRIEAALEAGEFANLPGAGKPLPLEDLSALDAELRASYVLLKNAGVLPEEMALKKELLTLGDLIRACGDAAEKRSLEERRSLLLLQHAILSERRRQG